MNILRSKFLKLHKEKKLIERNIITAFTKQIVKLPQLMQTVKNETKL